MATARARRTASTDVGHRLGHDAQRARPPRRARTPGWPGASRRRAGDHEAGVGGAEGLEHLGRVAARQQADHQDHRAGQGEVARPAVGGGRRGPVGVVGAVEHHRRLAADDLEAPGQRAARRRPRDDVVVQGPAEERLDRGQRDRGVVALVGAVDREVARRRSAASRRAQVDQPAADGHPVGVAAEVLVARPSVAAGPSARRTPPAGRGRSRPARGGCRASTMPAFSDGDRRLPARPRRRCGRGRRWCTTATCGVGHVGGVVAAEQPDLDHGDVDRDVGEPPEGGGGEDLEVRRAHPGQLLDRGDRADQLAERRRRRWARRPTRSAR